MKNNNDVFIPCELGIIVKVHEVPSLRGAPETVNGMFYCGGIRLMSLEGGPRITTDYYDCGDNNLTTLEGGPVEVGGDFCCGSNYKLTSLGGFPEYVGGIFDCTDNPNLPKSELYKIVDKVKGDIYYSDRRIPEDKYQLRRERDIAEMLKHDELGDLDV